MTAFDPEHAHHVVAYGSVLELRNELNRAVVEVLQLRRRVAEVSLTPAARALRAEWNRDHR